MYNINVTLKNKSWNFLGIFGILSNMYDVVFLKKYLTTNSR